MKSGPSAAHYEIAWTLFLAKMLRIILPANWVQPVTKLESSVCALILLDLRQMGLIDGTVDVSLWTQAMAVKGLESNLWLVAYEADLKSWLTPPVAGFVQNHPYFAALRQRNISFYDKQRRLKLFAVASPKSRQMPLCNIWLRYDHGRRTRSTSKNCWKNGSFLATTMAATEWTSGAQPIGSLGQCRLQPP